MGYLGHETFFENIVHLMRFVFNLRKIKIKSLFSYRNKYIIVVKHMIEGSGVCSSKIDAISCVLIRFCLRQLSLSTCVAR